MPQTVLELVEPPEPNPSHEVLRAFERIGQPLSGPLQEMLNEHRSHLTERRGCGFTQATRHLAEYINRPPALRGFDDCLLFAHKSPGVAPRLQARARELGHPLCWRNLEHQSVPKALKDDEMFAADHTAELERQRALRAVVDVVEQEESVLMTKMVRDIILPQPGPHSGSVLPTYPDRLKVGTCGLAEKYFLEVSELFIRRGGEVNVLCDDDGLPLLLEKQNLGDSHSCISLRTLTLNGVELPPGSLFGVKYAERPSGRPNAQLPGRVISVTDCAGFRFLRLTTLAVSPENRQRAFSAQLENQRRSGFFSPERVTISALLRLAEAQLNTTSRAETDGYTAKAETSVRQARYSATDVSMRRKVNDTGQRPFV